MVKEDKPSQDASSQTNTSCITAAYRPGTKHTRARRQEAHMQAWQVEMTGTAEGSPHQRQHLSRCTGAGDAKQDLQSIQTGPESLLQQTLHGL